MTTFNPLWSWGNHGWTLICLKDVITTTSSLSLSLSLSLSKMYYIYTYRERERESEKKGKNHWAGGSLESSTCHSIGTWRAHRSFKGCLCQPWGESNQPLIRRPCAVAGEEGLHLSSRTIIILGEGKRDSRFVVQMRSWIVEDHRWSLQGLYVNQNRPSNSFS